MPRIQRQSGQNPLPRGSGKLAGSVMRWRMPSRRQAVGPMVDKVLAAVEPAHFDEDQIHKLAVALAEALSNAAVHGNRLRAGTHVRVSVNVTPGQAVIDVADSGTGFDLDSVSDPTDAEHILVPGGRGVFLMRQLVDELRYNTTGNRVRLTVRART